LTLLLTAAHSCWLATGVGQCNAPAAEAIKFYANELLVKGGEELNAAWSGIIDGANLDPFTGINNIDYHITDSLKKICMGVCGAQLASCHAFTFHLGSTEVKGLKSVHWGDLKVDGIQMTPTTADQSITQCNIEANASASADTRLTIKLDIQNHAGGLRMYCKNAFKTWSELTWKGFGTCDSGTVHATATAQMKARTCSPPAQKDIAKGGSATVHNVNFDLSQLQCHFSSGQGIPYLPSILAFFKPDIYKELGKQLADQVPKALNNALAKTLQKAGIPSVCTNGAVVV